MTELTQEQILEQQKQNCIFCKIVSGEIESKKVYEDDNFLAILDIRPAAPGHVLLFPKQHVHILPLLSEERQLQLFTLADQLGVAVKDALIAERITIFVASGYAAGQQAPHVLLHIIPRESNDNLEMLDIPEYPVTQADTLALSSLFSQAVEQVLLHFKKIQPLMPKPAVVIKPAPIVAPIVEPREPILAKPESPVPVEFAKEFTNTQEALQAVLASNPDLRKLIMVQPSLVEDYVAKSPKLQKLFEGVDIQALSAILRKQEQSRATQKIAIELSEVELFAFIKANNGLHTWLLENPEEFNARLHENPRLSAFFDGVDILDLARRYKESQ